MKYSDNTSNTSDNDIRAQGTWKGFGKPQRLAEGPIMWACQSDFQETVCLLCFGGCQGWWLVMGSVGGRRSQSFPLQGLNGVFDYIHWGQG